MNKLFVVLVLVLIVLSGCKKINNSFVWERSFGTGKALFVRATADSGIISCGELGGKPYLIKLDKNKNRVAEYKYNDAGLFTSAWFNNDLSIVAGSTKGKMLILCLDNKSNLIWDTTFSSSYYMDFSSVCYLGNGELLAVGSASPDSVNSGAAGLYCVWFNTAGSITDKKEIKESSFISANRVVTDNSGNIYYAVTRKNMATMLKFATVAKYNSMLQKQWEMELHNNPGVGASSLGICLDNSGNIYVSGKTEISGVSGSSENSFSAKLANDGNIKWRKYPEISNSGSSIRIDESGQVLMLNHNCFIINVLNPVDGSAAGIIRTFNACDSKNTDTFGQDLDIDYDGNLIVAGSNGGGFYIGLKPPVLQTL